MRKGLTAIGIILVIVCSPRIKLHAAPADYSSVQAGEALQAWLERDIGDFDAQSELSVAVVRFYQARQFEFTWMGLKALTPQGSKVLKTLLGTCDGRTPELAAYVHQLVSHVKDATLFVARGQAIPLGALLQAEVGIAQIALYFAAQLDAEFLDPDESAWSPQQQIAAKLANVLPGPTWSALRDATGPRQKPYQALKKSLERYQSIQLLGGWPSIPEGPQLKAGLVDSRVPLLRRRLIIGSDMKEGWLSDAQSFDDTLVEGVRQFQRRHGLVADGVVGADTLAELNTSVQDRIAQIKLNMMRWRSLPARLGPNYILVNIPGFKLDVVENYHVVRSMRAIVGKRNRRTPVISAMMTYLEINPYWNIPQKIARKDLLPRIQNDPRFLVRQNIQVFSSWKEGAAKLDPLAIDWQSYSKANFPPFRLRQRPTVSNALGRVKFIFPNRFSVYIHDTPAKSLFDRISRSFSAGCVRIEKPLALAEYLLAGQGWDDERIDEKIRSRKRMVVALKAPIPVHLVYLTAWVDENGTVYFYQDLYGRDKPLQAGQKQYNPELPALMADMMNIDQILEENNRSTASKSSEQTAGANNS